MADTWRNGRKYYIITLIMEGKFTPKKQEYSAPLGKEFETISLLADLRRREIEVKRMLVNIEAKKEDAPDQTSAYIEDEINGRHTHPKEKALKELTEEERSLINDGEIFSLCASNYSSFLFGYLAKLKQSSGKPFQDDLDKAKKLASSYEKLPREITVSDILPQAQIVSINKKMLTERELPSIEKIASLVQSNPLAVREVALALSENDRQKVLSLIKEEDRGKFSLAFDSAVSEVLPSSFVEKNDYAKEREIVKSRLFDELLKETKNESIRSPLVKTIARAIGNLGGSDVNYFLRTTILEEMDDQEIDADGKEFIPRVIKTLLDEFDNYRANDVALRFASEMETPDKITRYIAARLIERDYLPKDIAEWYEQNKKKYSNDIQAQANIEQHATKIFKLVAGGLGVIPSKDILAFIDDNNQWKDQKGNGLSLEERVEKIKESKEKFEAIHDNSKLLDLLAKDSKKAMVYYMVYGGTDRFALINDYNFSKFKEVLEKTKDFSIHEKPLQLFRNALGNSGMEQNTVSQIESKLRNGHFPLNNNAQATQLVNFEAMAGGILEQANAALGISFGRTELGVLYLFPMYRNFLEKTKDPSANTLLEEMKRASTFSTRLEVISKIEESYPHFKQAAKTELEPLWKKLGEKIILDASIGQVLFDDAVPVRGEEILPKLETKRIDLKRMKKELLALMRGENQAIKKVSDEISKKKRIRKTLVDGMVHQKDSNIRASIENKIADIDGQIALLEKERLELGNIASSDRFAHLSPEEKNTQIESLSKEVIAIGQKEKSAFFTYLAMQVIGEEKLRESDIDLIKEFENHLQGPFQQLSDERLYENRSGGKKNVAVELSYVDKCDRLMNAVRFADSKICCFSSKNYSEGDPPRKTWVASINKDPMSFVLSIEAPAGTKTNGDEKMLRNNLGFIFGSFGLDDGGKLALMLNGIYYDPGNGKKDINDAFVRGVEKMFQGLPFKTLSVASKYGGAQFGVYHPDDFTNDSVEIIRLRALDDGSGKPESHIYDDLLDSKTDLNKPHKYGGNVWHKFYK